jgi:hypothetical protein
MTNHSESIAELSAAVAAAFGEFPDVPKEAKNDFFKSKYATLATVLGTIRPILTKHGLAVLQFPAVSSDSARVLALETTLLHSSGEWISLVTEVPMVKADPQGYGSAMTYTRRYSLLAVLGLAAEDDDGHAASQPGSKPAPAPRAASKPAPVAATAPAAGGGATLADVMRSIGEAGFKDDAGKMTPEGFAWAGRFVAEHEASKKWSEWSPEVCAAAVADLAQFNPFGDQ